jgi:hypothetical protein
MLEDKGNFVGILISGRGEKPLPANPKKYVGVKSC